MSEQYYQETHILSHNFSFSNYILYIKTINRILHTTQTTFKSFKKEHM